MSKMFTGLHVRGVIEFNFRDDFSGRVGIRGKRVNRCTPAEWVVQWSSLLPACDMCGEFRASGASVLIVMYGIGGCVSFCLTEVLLSSEGFLRYGVSEWGSGPRVARAFSFLYVSCPVCAL